MIDAARRLSCAWVSALSTTWAAVESAGSQGVDHPAPEVFRARRDVAQHADGHEGEGEERERSGQRDGRRNLAAVEVLCTG